MRYIQYFGTDAYTNIAMDAWLLSNLHADEPVFALWRNKNAVIIGRNQDTYEEINQDVVEQKDIQVVRRVTGGGAVYHDLGNICFSLFVPVTSETGKIDFGTFIQPVLKALQKMGIPAELTGRNDLVVDGKKISGNAQRMERGYVLHHGTLMYDVDIDTMVRALNVSDDKFISKAAKSVRSRVGMIHDIKPDLSYEDLMAGLMDELTNHGQDGEYELTDEQKQSIMDLRNNRFATWNWTYGESPAADFENEKRFPGGTLGISANLADGRIKDIDFTGDFLGLEEWRDIKDQFIGIPFTKEALLKVLNQANDEQQYFGSISNDEIASLLDVAKETNTDFV
ncbi:lipoate-protein ligase A [Weissella uvarum]|uniref:lipoate--protein ligase n=1 Tax=Weissella uvarum TaxID=1479233 RepID=UPI001960C60D|nr:lipoate--protein ligase [Weissella uvarum]MBM7617420.1 lipoate-protein ligase A [Weissella uvarum]MCM0595695.1 lipoate--protein ligase [Weissella uvarum]